MKRSDIKILPEYFDYYIKLVEDVELDDAFRQSLKQIDHLDTEKLKRIGLKTYAAGKWTVQQIIQHLIDWERIYCYRTLVFARDVNIVPEGIDQDLMAEQSNANELTLDQLMDELRIVRQATKALFNSFNNYILGKNCSFYKYEMSVLAMGFNIIGHQVHHFGVIEQRYFPLD